MESHERSMRQIVDVVAATSNLRVGFADLSRQWLTDGIPIDYSKDKPRPYEEMSENGDDEKGESSTQGTRMFSRWLTRSSTYPSPLYAILT